MKGNPDPKGTKGTFFSRVKKSYNTASGARLHPPKMTVGRTGAIRSNTEGKGMVQAFVKEQGGDPANFHLAFGANEEAGQLALYVPQPGDLGLMKVSIYENSISFHAGAVFEEHPKLRPTATLDCSIEKTTDGEGTPCLTIQIHGGTPTRTVKRKPKSDSAQGEDKK